MIIRNGENVRHNTSPKQFYVAGLNWFALPYRRHYYKEASFVITGVNHAVNLLVNDNLNQFFFNLDFLNDKIFRFSI